MVDYLKWVAAAAVLLWSYGSVAAENEPTAHVLGISRNLENPDAVLTLATRYEHGEGMPRDYSKAAELYCDVARAGHAAALYSLGWMYANGRGVTKDDGVAAQLFRLAADQGHVHARKMLQYVKSSSDSVLPACLTPVPPPTAIEEKTEIKDIFPKGPVFELVTKLAPRYKIDPGLALAVISVESGFNVKAVSPKNAQGLMQLMPETAQRFRVKNVFDPEENIKGGLAYLQWLLAYFKGNVALVAAAYNAGERAVEAYRGIPPYPETRNYVRKITTLYEKADHPYQPHIVGASLVMTRLLNSSR